MFSFNKIWHRYVLGNPLDSATTMGPMALPSAQDVLTDQVEKAKEQGAIVITGGEACTDSAGKGR